MIRDTRSGQLSGGGRLRVNDIEKNMQKYRCGQESRTPRYTSFDYCFNYFQSHHEADGGASLAEPQNMEVSCLQLGFYLASWGMLRGRSPLLSQSVKYYEPIIKVISEALPAVWKIDVDSYSDESCGLLLETAKRLKHAFTEPATDTLLTKVMLGVFGCVPAYDSYFRRGLGKRGVPLGRLGRSSLEILSEAYRANAEDIDQQQRKTKTLDFQSGELTERSYSRAKVIDAVFFIEGRG